jgi:hypothetical protein
VPTDLRALLLESDGLQAEYGLNLVWSLERIRKDNLYFRQSADFCELYLSFDQLLFFGDAGNGDQFAFPCLPDRDHEVFVWNHEDDSRSWLAPRLSTFLEWWGSRRIRL